MFESSIDEAVSEIADRFNCTLDKAEFKVRDPITELCDGFRPATSVTSQHATNATRAYLMRGASPYVYIVTNDSQGAHRILHALYRQTSNEAVRDRLLLRNMDCLRSIEFAEDRVNVSLRVNSRAEVAYELGQEPLLDAVYEKIIRQ
jgi:hypothetical protein